LCNIEIRQKIRQAQYEAMKTVNVQLINGIYFFCKPYRYFGTKINIFYRYFETKINIFYRYFETNFVSLHRNFETKTVCLKEIF
jgi:hypothetical protein